jgi:DNA-binding Lrp family transcriptional regulator
MSKTLERRNNVSNNKRGSMVSIPMDQLNLKIIKDMISDTDVKSVDMAKRYNTPLSTIQRRRTKLERTILKRRYYIDISRLGWRQADLLISVAQGDCEELGRKLLDKYRSNIIATSLRIGNPEINLVVQAFYQNSEELHWLLERIKSIPEVKSVDWSEAVKIVETDNARMIDRVFGGKDSVD